MSHLIALAALAATTACGAGTATTLVDASPATSMATPSDSALTVSVQPDPARRGEEAVVTIRGRAFGGRHLSVSSFHVEGLGGWAGGPGCAADPSHEPAIPDDPFELTAAYTWKDPGTYTVKIELAAHCRMDDIPQHSVTADIRVE